MPARAAEAPIPRGNHGRYQHHHHFRKILVLPGNPGCSSFYSPFAEALSDELGGTTEVVALSFHGHETSTAEVKGKEGRRKARKPLCLDGQVEHASDFLEKILREVDEEQNDKSFPAGSVAVVGHSIGGTVAALAVREVEERRRRRKKEEAALSLSSRSSPSPSASSSPLPFPKTKIAAVCAMMPYVAFDEGSSQQRALRLLAGSPLARVPACLGARALGALLPRTALSALVALATASSPLTKHARETVADFVSAGGLDHALFLAKTEFKALSVVEAEKREEEEKEKNGSSKAPKFSVSSASEIWAPLASLGRRASVFAVGKSGEEGSEGNEKDDHWCPGHHLDLLKAQAPFAKLQLDPSQRHDFVVCDERTARAAKAVAGLLRETALAAAAAAAAAEEEEEAKR